MRGRRAGWVTAAALAAWSCDGEPDVPLSPDQVTSAHAASTTGAGGATTSGTGGNDGAGGAGGGPDMPGGYVSGSRLRVRYLDGSDGSRQAIGWYDTVLQDNCEFLGDDDMRHCYPGVPELTGFVSLWANSTCTMPAKRVPNGCDGAKFVRSGGANACGVSGSIEVFPAVQLTTVYQFNGGNCVQVTQVTAYQVTGPALATSELVSATVETE